MSGAEWVDVIIKLTAIGGAVALVWNATDKFFKTRVLVAKEQSVGAKALEEVNEKLRKTEEELHSLNAKVQSWDAVVQRFLAFLEHDQRGRK